MNLVDAMKTMRREIPVHKPIHLDGREYINGYESGDTDAFLLYRVDEVAGAVSLTFATVDWNVMHKVILIQADIARVPEDTNAAKIMNILSGSCIVFLGDTYEETIQSLSESGQLYWELCDIE